ncbi:MAG: hypothetical protein M1826_001890 [Phylliscum demangeonii]|nr:MAG: hypothetical protein M1826_001890 [Phylliscum demangeonii]
MAARVSRPAFELIYKGRLINSPEPALLLRPRATWFLQWNRHQNLILAGNLLILLVNVRQSTARKVHKSTMSLATAGVGLKLAINLIRRGVQATEIAIIVFYQAQFEVYKASLQNALVRRSGGERRSVGPGRGARGQASAAPSSLGRRTLDAIVVNALGHGALLQFPPTTAQIGIILYAGVLALSMGFPDLRALIDTAAAIYRDRTHPTRPDATCPLTAREGFHTYLADEGKEALHQLVRPFGRPALCVPVGGRRLNPPLDRRPTRKSRNVACIPFIVPHKTLVADPANHLDTRREHKMIATKNRPDPFRLMSESIPIDSGSHALVRVLFYMLLTGVDARPDLFPPPSSVPRGGSFHDPQPFTPFLSGMIYCNRLWLFADDLERDVPSLPEITLGAATILDFLPQTRHDIVNEDVLYLDEGARATELGRVVSLARYNPCVIHLVGDGALATEITVIVL